MNTFGRCFRITTFGESHGPMIGVVIDGCPAGLALSQELIQDALDQRRGGRSPYTTPRKEPDIVEIVSGVYVGKTTGAPICLLIRNQDVRSEPYAAIAQTLRPGHADFTYWAKYGHFDPRGGGRASARETAARVAAGAVAKQLLQTVGITVHACIEQIGPIKALIPEGNWLTERNASPLFCPDTVATVAMEEILKEALLEGDSWGGVVFGKATGVPVGLGEPVYGKLEAELASAMLSIPASKGFAIGSGFEAAQMRGSEHNDPFIAGETITCATNHAGGVLGGISTGMPIVFRVAFKPTSSIKKAQATVTTNKTETLLQLGREHRHDPCVAIRAVFVVEAMTAIVLADQRLAKIASPSSSAVTSASVL
jgi:chorismate synthase